MGLGDEVELAIFVRDAGRIVAGISGWTWGDCCELQSLWVEPSLRRSLARIPAPRRRRSRGGGARVHADRPLHLRLPGSALYERAGYELVGRVEDFPSGTDVLWYRKRLRPWRSAQSTPDEITGRSGAGTAAVSFGRWQRRAGSGRPETGASPAERRSCVRSSPCPRRRPASCRAPTHRAPHRGRRPDRGIDRRTARLWQDDPAPPVGRPAAERRVRGLDDRDNDPVALISCIATALDRVEPLTRPCSDFRFARTFASSRRSCPVSSRRSGRGTPTVLMLDDVHRLSEPACARRHRVRHAPPAAEPSTRARRASGAAAAVRAPARRGHLLEVGAEGPGTRCQRRPRRWRRPSVSDLEPMRSPTS